MEKWTKRLRYLSPVISALAVIVISMTIELDGLAIMLPPILFVLFTISLIGASFIVDLIWGKLAKQQISPEEQTRRKSKNYSKVAFICQALALIIAFFAPPYSQMDGEKLQIFYYHSFFLLAIFLILFALYCIARSLYLLIKTNDDIENYIPYFVAYCTFGYLIFRFTGQQFLDYFLIASKF